MKSDLVQCFAHAGAVSDTTTPVYTLYMGKALRTCES